MAESDDETAENKTKTVAFRLDAEKNRQWEEYAEENPEYDSKSHLIRRAVAREIHGGGGTPANSGEGGGLSTEKADKLLDAVLGMQGQLADLEDRVADAERSMRSGGSVDQETTTAVWSALPTAPEAAVTAEGLADGTDVDPETARVALEQLHDNTGSAVQKREIEQIEEGDGTVTVTDPQGRTLEIEDPGTAVRRRNPLFWRVE